MRLVFDMDGTITEGRYLSPPRTREAYMSLAPYDNNTMDVLYDVCLDHEVYIVTARSEPMGHVTVDQWLRANSPALPRVAGIITGIEQPYKYSLAVMLGADLMFDDSPKVWQTYLDWPFGDDKIPDLYMMDNPAWDRNQTVISYKRIYSWKKVNEIINETSHNTKSYTHQSRS